MSVQLVLECCKQYDELPYPEPCPIRGECGAYRCETGGCSGERGWCMAAQLASGRTVPEWRTRLLSGYTRRAYEKRGWL